MDKNTGKSVEDSFKAEMERASAATAAADTTTQPNGATGTPTKDSTVSESPKYEFNGRQLTAEQLYEETRNLQKDYTVKTQELAELKKSSAKSESTTTTLAPEQGNNGQTLSDVDQRMQAELRRLGAVFKDDLDKTIDQKKPELIKESSNYTQSQIDIKSRFDAIEGKYDGVEGKPKVDRSEVLQWINQKQAYHLSPEEATNIVYHDQIVKWEARVLAGQGGNTNLPTTEKSGASVTEPPTPPANALSFQNGSAERAFADMIGNR